MAEPLKNAFDRPLVERLGAAGAAASEAFDADAFIAEVMAELPALELKDRVALMADRIFEQLGGDFDVAVPAVVEMAADIGRSARAREGASAAGSDADAWGETMEAWPLCSVVERHGTGSAADVEASLAAMEQLTRSFSCEFAIRPFLNQYFDRTIEECRRWTGSSSPAVRRLASEGTRPYLPWGSGVKALVADPEIGIGLISELRHDPNESVRRSVANHLNDIARHAPDRVAEVASAWLAEPETEAPMVRHALRGLVKKGHEGAMQALGFTTKAELDVEAFTVEPSEIRLGASIELTATVRSTTSAPQRLVVDFVIHHVNANGETSPKVFKWTTIELESGTALTFAKKRKIQTASTRRYHAGIHRVELQIAGQVVADAAFELLESS